jgi:hypothetical protein
MADEGQNYSLYFSVGHAIHDSRFSSQIRRSPLSLVAHPQPLETKCCRLAPIRWIKRNRPALPASQ